MTFLCIPFHHNFCYEAYEVILFIRILYITYLLEKSRAGKFLKSGMQKQQQIELNVGTA
jgi:hypothetical protein